MSSQNGHPIHSTTSMVSPWVVGDEAGPSSRLSTSQQLNRENDNRSPTERSADKSKRTQSCDSCRKRKIKCIQSVKVDGKAASKKRCVACTAIGVDCTYVYVPKKPGPQSSRNLKQARVEPQRTASTSSSSGGKAARRDSIVDKVNSNGHATLQEKDEEDIMTMPSAIDLWSTSPSLYPSFPGASPEDLSAISDLAPGTLAMPMQWTPAMDSLPSPTFTITSPSLASFPATNTTPGTTTAATSATTTTPYSFDQYQNLPRYLDDVAPRHLFMHIMAIYVEHLYPLLPIVHKPTLEGFLAVRRDDTDTEFLAFVLSLSAYTLLEAPQSILPINRQYSEQLREICHSTSRRLQRRTYESPKMIDICTLYLDHLYLSGTNFTNSANAVLAQAISLSYTLGLHNEELANTSAADSNRPPTPASNIERELRRRIYYLLYGSDKSIALIQNRPMLLRDDNSFLVTLPRVSEEEAMMNDKTAISINRNFGSMLGFVTVTKLYRLLSEVLESRKGVERRPPSHPKDIQEHKLYIRAMLNKVRSTTEAFAKSQGASSKFSNPIFSGSATFAGSHLEDVHKNNGGTRLDSNKTIQANIAITSAMIRFALKDYQDLCFKTTPPNSNPNSSFSLASAISTIPTEMSELELIAAELSSTLESIPIDCLIANGHGFVSKLLYITSKLVQTSQPGTSNYNHLSKLIDTLTRLTLLRNGDETTTTSGGMNTNHNNLNPSSWSTPSSSSIPASM